MRLVSIKGFEEGSEKNEWRQDNKSTRKEVEEAEWQGSFKAMDPVIRSVLRARGYPLLSRKLRDILNSCPSFWCHYKCMTELRWHKPVNGNDIWDFLHVAMAVPYVDCLASDGGTKSILCAGPLGMDKKFGIRVISEENDLIDWLQGV
jgi:hypothetical protein